MKSTKNQMRKILWLFPLILDFHFHKVSRLEISYALSKLGYDTSLVAMRSKNRIQNGILQVHIISIL
jgi:hypothetical protein